MPKSDLISGIVLMVFGVVLLVFVIPAQTSEAGDASISPALLPQICAAGITALAALLTFASVGKLRKGEAAGASVPAAEWWSGAVVLLTVTVCVVLFIWVNPALAAGLMIVGLMLYMGERRIGFLVGIPAVLLVGTWALFYKVLGTAIT